MKNRLSFRLLIVLLLISLLMLSCNEDEPDGEIFSWSPDGKKLAVITDQSKELLLADIEMDSIRNISVIDNYKGKKNNIFAPRWSYDGKYFLYTKLKNDTLNLIINSFSTNSLMLLTTIPLNFQLNASKSEHFPEWALDKNLILFTELYGGNENQIVTINPDGSNKTVLTQVDCNFLFPTWSPDGQWIAFLTGKDKNNDQDKSNIWKIKSDGSLKKHIYCAKDMSAPKWSPDGSSFATTKFDNNQTDTSWVLFTVDTQGQHERIISRNTTAISEYDWSPDGKYISYVQQADDKKNIWLVDVQSLKKTRLTFDNVRDYFGWQKPGHLLFTIKYPETIVDLSESEENKQEISELIRGINKENILISFNTTNFSKIFKNVLTYKYCPANKTEAFMQICRKPELLGDERYLPAVKFANGNIEYLPRTDEEYIIAADNQFINQNYNKAFSHINNYWDIDINSNEFRTYFNADSIIHAEEMGQDSNHVDLMMESVRNGALIKTIMILDRLKQNEKVSWLFDQYFKLTSFFIKNETNNQDELYWNLIATYGKYGELDMGIKDLDKLLSSVEGDSLFRCYTNLAQAFLAYENGSYDICLEKIKISFENMPVGKAELEPYNSLISVFLEKTNYEYNANLISILKEFWQRFPNNGDTFDTLIILGDYYQRIGRSEQALFTYQTAVSKKPGQQQIWDKIFELEKR